MRVPPPAATIGLLSTYPPTACGLATFSAALAAALHTLGTDVRVVRIADDAPDPGGNVVGQLVNDVAGSPASAAALLDECGAVVVQHEYGIYGGTDGDEIIEILGALTVPSIVVAHTVLRQPTANQRRVLEEVAELAHQVVVMSEAARTRLCGSFRVDPTKVTTIPHGATVPPPMAPRPAGGRPTLLTWGLLGPGKGIERVIDVLPALTDLAARPRYVVAGRTHPKVLAADGEAYRYARIEQAWRVGVAAGVTFDEEYRDVPSLTALAAAADVIVLPYDSTDQVTSGVLVDAIAAGRPVIATAFPHAVELLASGAGIVVDHDDPDGLERAIRDVLTEPGRARSMAREAARLAPGMSWPVVARSYADLAERLLDAQLAAA